MNKRKRNILIATVTTIVITTAGILVGASCYMLNFSLGYKPAQRLSKEAQLQRVRRECPWTNAWMDSVYSCHCLRDTFITMPSGYRAHAIYLHAPHPTDSTAVVVHGYKMRAESMLHIAYLYHHDMGWNVLLPDLYGHGQSDGDHIQMGCLDRWDAIRWAEVAHSIFSADNDSAYEVMHGISMGAATTMAASGEKTPYYLQAFVEDCGYTSVRDEFTCQLKEQFGLPAFPLMDVTSWLCRLKYGWSFDGIRQIDQVAKCSKPMLFIHGDNDDFVPSWMVHPLYSAKRKGRKAIFIAKGSVHAMAYRDHHKEYTQAVREFLRKVKR